MRFLGSLCCLACLCLCAETANSYSSVLTDPYLKESREATPDNIKLASIRFITDGTVNSGSIAAKGKGSFACPSGTIYYLGRCQANCDRSLYPFSSIPSREKGAIDSCKGPSGKFYRYIACNEGWKLQNSDCIVTLNADDYPLTSLDNTVGYGECQVIAGQTRCRYTSCNDGWDGPVGGNCTIHSCSGYPYTVAPSGEAGTLLPVCKSGTENRYAYKNCNEGWTYGNGYCTVRTCSTSEYPLTTADYSIGNVAYCKSGTTYRYAYTGCYDGYDLQDGLCEAIPQVPDYALRFMVKVLRSGGELNMSVNGDWTVDWGDGTITSGHDGSPEHTYNTTGEFEVRLSGNNITMVNSVYTYHPNDADNCATWNINGSDFINMFYSAGSGASQYPQLHFCSQLMFSIDSPSVGFSEYRRAYQDCMAGIRQVFADGNGSVIPKLESWCAPAGEQNTSIYVSQVLDIYLPSVTDYDSLFYEQFLMTGDLSELRFPDNLQQAGAMFFGCASVTGTPHLPNSLRYADSMFYDCKGIESVPQLPTSLEDGGSMFEGCWGMTGMVSSWPSGIYNAHDMFADNPFMSGTCPLIGINSQGEYINSQGNDFDVDNTFGYDYLPEHHLCSHMGQSPSMSGSISGSGSGSPISGSISGSSSNPLCCHYGSPCGGSYPDHMQEYMCRMPH